MTYRVIGTSAAELEKELDDALRDIDATDTGLSDDADEGAQEDTDSEGRE